MERESFVFYRSFWESIKELPREIQGEVLTAIVEYGLYGATTENPKPIAGAILTLIKPVIDANNKRFTNGKNGGRPLKTEPNQNQSITKPKPKHNQSITKPKPKHNQSITKPKPNEDEDIDIISKKIESVLKKSFVQITDLSETLSSFQGNKGYLFLAYRYWELWKEQSPNNLTVQKAKVETWYNAIEKMKKNGVSTQRIIAVYLYFSYCLEDRAGYDKFWFETIKSISGLMNKKNEVYNIDRIIGLAEKKIDTDNQFRQDFENLLTNYKKKYESD